MSQIGDILHHQRTVETVIVAEEGARFIAGFRQEQQVVGSPVSRVRQNTRSVTSRRVIRVSPDAAKEDRSAMAGLRLSRVAPDRNAMPIRPPERVGSFLALWTWA